MVIDTDSEIFINSEKVTLIRKKGRLCMHRVKYTTALQKNLIVWLKHRAIELDKYPADLIEDALLKYKKETESIN